MNDGAALILKEDILISYTSAKTPSCIFLTEFLVFSEKSNVMVGFLANLESSIALEGPEK